MVVQFQGWWADARSKGLGASIERPTMISAGKNGMAMDMGSRWVKANLDGLQVWPALEAESIAQLPPCHELVKKLLGTVAAVTEAVSRHLERRDHSEMMVCCR